MDYFVDTFNEMIIYYVLNFPRLIMQIVKKIIVTRILDISERCR